MPKLCDRTTIRVRRNALTELLAEAVIAGVKLPPGLFAKPRSLRVWLADLWYYRPIITTFAREQFI